MGHKTIVIPLTDRPSVEIEENEWPIIADTKDYNGETEVQSTDFWRLTVRQHKDGRAIVYGSYESDWRDRINLYAGEVLSIVANTGRIIESIYRVGKNAKCEQIIQPCIHDLPSEKIE